MKDGIHEVTNTLDLGSLFSEAQVPYDKEASQALKGLGHIILGNFSTDQTVIELT